jgi:hypothetical protein
LTGRDWSNTPTKNYNSFMAQLVFDIETVGMPLDLSPDPSPKGGGEAPLSASGRGWGRGLPKGRLSGPQVNQLFAEGKYREIAQYCADDVRATAELYRRWHEFLSFEE